jgi:hypothetical protein
MSRLLVAEPSTREQSGSVVPDSSRWRLPIVAYAALMMASCGSNSAVPKPDSGGTGGTASGGANGGTSGTAGTGSAGGAGSSVGGTAGTADAGPCPAQIPLTGDACDLGTFFTCEYGDDSNSGCHTFPFCQGGAWQNYGTAPDCPSTLATSCPATMKAAIDASCSEMGSWCSWGFGTGCQCTNCVPGPGEPNCMGSPTWHCPQSMPDCPSAMPRSGSPCSTLAAGGLCEYGCAFGARRCVSGYWQVEDSDCPVSTRAAKEDIRYLSAAEVDRVAAQTEAMRLARYRYRSPAFGAPGTHLGFIIEDNPDVPAVSPSRRTVDLYGFASMLLATSQAQQRKIEALEQEIAELRRAVRQKREH